MQDNNRNLPTTNQPTIPSEPTTSQFPSSAPSSQPSHSSLPSSSSAPSASSEPTKVGDMECSHCLLVLYILSPINHYSILAPD